MYLMTPYHADLALRHPLPTSPYLLEEKVAAVVVWQEKMAGAAARWLGWLDLQRSAS